LKKIFRPRNIFLALVALIVLHCADIAYRLNNVCAVEQHIIESEADAIAIAKNKAVSNDSGEFNASFLDALSKAEHCCTVIRDRNGFFLVIAWHVSLSARDGRFAQITLSNCGDVFDEDTYWDSEIYRHEIPRNSGLYSRDR
jgi:hypothetical protein